LPRLTPAELGVIYRRAAGLIFFLHLPLPGRDQSTQ
jgi:hypothetical protein